MLWVRFQAHVGTQEIKALNNVGYICLLVPVEFKDLLNQRDLVTYQIPNVLIDYTIKTNYLE